MNDSGNDSATAVGPDGSHISEFAAEFLQNEGESLKTLDPVPPAKGAAKSMDTIAKAVATKGPPAAKLAGKSRAAVKNDAPIEDSHEEDNSHGEDSPDEAPIEEARQALKYRKVKVNGREYTVPEENVDAELSRGYALRQKADEVSRLKSEVESMRAALQAEKARLDSEDGAAEYLKKHKGIAEKLLEEDARDWYEMQNMTPRERELYTSKKQLEEKNRTFEAQAKREQAQRQTQLVAEQNAHLEKVFTDALVEHKLPKNTLTLRVMAGIYRAALKPTAEYPNGRELSAADVAALSRKQLREIADAAYGEMSDEDFIEAYPKRAESIRAYQLKKARQPAAELGDVPRKAGATQRAPTGQFKKPDPAEKWEQELSELKRRGAEERVKNRWF